LFSVAPAVMESVDREPVAVIVFEPVESPVDVLLELVTEEPEFELSVVEVDVEVDAAALELELDVSEVLAPVDLEAEVAPVAAMRVSKSDCVVHVVRVPEFPPSKGIAAQMVPAAHDWRTNFPPTHCANFPVTHASSPAVQEALVLKVLYWLLRAIAAWPFARSVASRRMGRAAAAMARARATKEERISNESMGMGIEKECSCSRQMKDTRSDLVEGERTSSHDLGSRERNEDE